jgi:signal transduction histidine kinase
MATWVAAGLALLSLIASALTALLLIALLRSAAAPAAPGTSAAQTPPASPPIPKDGDRLERLLQMRSRLLAFAAHDIRTPLGIIEGFSHLLLRAPETKKSEYLFHIDRAVSVIRRLLGDLTDIGTIETGRLRLSFSTFDAVALAKEAVAGLEPAARAKGVRLSVKEARGELPIQADRFRLAQALQNLAANAVKFTPEGGQVEVAIYMEEGWLELSVTDTGPGVDPQEAARLFTPYYQSKRLGPAERSGGLGLGLAIAEEIAKAHGGRAGVDSPGPGAGSKFWLRIPAAPVESSAAPQPIPGSMFEPGPADEAPLVPEAALSAPIVEFQLLAAQLQEQLDDIRAKLARSLQRLGELEGTASEDRQVYDAARSEARLEEARRLERGLSDSVHRRITELEASLLDSRRGDELDARLKRLESSPLRPDAFADRLARLQKLADSEKLEREKLTAAVDRLRELFGDPDDFRGELAKLGTNVARLAETVKLRSELSGLQAAGLLQRLGSLEAEVRAVDRTRPQ